MPRAPRGRPFRAGERRNVEPPLGLAGLATLVDRHRTAGLEVELAAHGPRRPLAPGVDQAAYRILQEALTNAARHGDGRAEVAVTYEDDSLALTVSNPTRQAHVENGHGIVGMRERAALLGGTLDVSASNGTFRIHARLPYGGST